MVDDSAKVAPCPDFVKRAFSGATTQGIDHDCCRHSSSPMPASSPWTLPARAPKPWPSRATASSASARADDVAALKAKHTRVIDAQMKTVMPGIIEGHVHLFGGSGRTRHLNAQWYQWFRGDCGIGFSISAGARPNDACAARHRHRPRELRRARSPARSSTASSPTFPSSSVASTITPCGPTPRRWKRRAS